MEEKNWLNLKSSNTTTDQVLKLIKVACKKCGKDLTEPGGILFGMPIGSEKNVDVVAKRHLCRDCYNLVEHFIDADIHITVQDTRS